MHLAVLRDAKIRVAGPNGIGKSSLLATMLRGAHIAPERILYLPQELTARDGIAMLDAVRGLNAGDRGRVLTLVAALGIDPDRLLESAAPSPGEARKLAMAYGLGRQVWAMVLDEPTNHLDMPAIEQLEQALFEYPGAMLIVTHDNALARRCTNIEWRVDAGRVEVKVKRPETILIQHDAGFWSQVVKLDETGLLLGETPLAGERWGRAVQVEGSIHRIFPSSRSPHLRHSSTPPQQCQ